MYPLHGRDEYEVIWPHRPEEQHANKTATEEDGKQAAKRQTCKDLVPTECQETVTVIDFSFPRCYTTREFQ